MTSLLRFDRKIFYDDFKGIVELLSFPVVVEFDFDLINGQVDFDNLGDFTVKFEATELVFSDHDFEIVVLWAGSYQVQVDRDFIDFGFFLCADLNSEKVVS